MKRALALLAPALLVVGLVACGDDDDDSPDTTTATEATTDVTTADVTAPPPTARRPTPAGPVDEAATDTMRQIFPNLSDDQVDCLVEQVDDFTDADRPGAGAGHRRRVRHRPGRPRCPT